MERERHGTLYNRIMKDLNEMVEGLIIEKKDWMKLWGTYKVLSLGGLVAEHLTSRPNPNLSPLVVCRLSPRHHVFTLTLLSM